MEVEVHLLPGGRSHTPESAVTQRSGSIFEPEALTAVVLFVSPAQSLFLKDGDPHSPRVLKTQKPQEDENNYKTSSCFPLWSILFRMKKVILSELTYQFHLAGGN